MSKDELTVDFCVNRSHRKYDQDESAADLKVLSLLHSSLPSEINAHTVDRQSAEADREVEINAHMTEAERQADDCHDELRRIQRVLDKVHRTITPPTRR
jgi:hypothetical protein